MTVQAITMIFAFAFGAVVGSFLNVVIWRVPRGESIVRPPSHCPGCGKGLRWYHNVPIVSWVVLRGRCAFCRAPIDARYPTVELITAMLALACVAVWGPSPMAARTFALAAMLVALTYIDLEHWILPHAITWPGIILGVATAWVPEGPGMRDALIGAGAGFATLWLLQLGAEWIFKQQALGGGDVFLFSMIGAFLGWQALLPVLFLASVQGSIAGIFFILARRRQAVAEAPPGELPSQEAPPPGEGEPPAAADEDAEEDWTPPPSAVPFGPFLSLGALEMAFAGGLVMDAVFRFIGL